MFRLPLTLLAVVFSFAIATPLCAQSPTRLARVEPDPTRTRFEVPNRLSVAFSRPLLPSSLGSAAVTVRQGLLSLVTAQSLSRDGRTVTLDLDPALASTATGSAPVVLRVDGDLLRDLDGFRIDADGNGQPGGQFSATFDLRSPAPPPTATGSAMILGRVFSVTTGQPLAGVEVKAKLFPALETDPYLPVPSAFSDAQGFFQYQTPSFEATEVFLLKVRGTNTSERLHRVEVLAGGCIRVPDSFVQPLNPPVPVQASAGASLGDPARGIELDIPGNALQQSSNISVTGLFSPDLIRERLPVNNAPVGVFTDVEGVFGEQTLDLVTFRVPNTLNLPVGTRVPFGKVDHNTLLWSDLRDFYTGNDPAERDRRLGIVRSDGQGGTFIEVQFDHFCTVCTGYCLPSSPPAPNNDSPGPRDPWGGPNGPSGGGGGGPPAGGPNGTPPPLLGGGPTGVPGVSIGIDRDIIIIVGGSRVLMSEGHLWEDIAIPGFEERGRPVGLSLGYASYTARPTLTLCASFTSANARPVEGSVFTFEIAGQAVTGVYGRSTDVRPRGSFIWDGRDGLGQQMPTGFYPYSIRITNLNADEPVSIPTVFGGPSNGQNLGVGNFQRPGAGTLAGGPFASLPANIIPVVVEDIVARGVLINQIASAFGAGWSLQEVDRLHFDSDGCITVTFGNGCWTAFTPGGRDPETGRNLWLSPDGEPSRLSQDPLDGSFLREWPEGQTERFDGGGRLLSRRDRYGYLTRYDWTNNRLVRITTPVGNWWAFDYNVSGKVTRIRDSAGRTTLLNVDAAGDLRTVTDAVGGVRRFTYSADHLLSEQRTSVGARFTYDWISGRCVATRAYDTDGVTLLRERRFEPQVLVGEVNAALAQGFGAIGGPPIPVSPARVHRMIDGEGGQWQLEQDAQGRTIRQIDPLNRELRIARDATGRPTLITYSDGTATRYTYDAAGRVTQLDELRTNGSLLRRTRAEYAGPFGKVSRIIDPNNRETLFQYDALGNLVAMSDASGALWGSLYEDPRFPDLPTRFIDPEGLELRLVYNSQGNAEQVLSILDQSGQMAPEVTTLSYDSQGLISGIARPDGRSVAMMHDALGRRTQFQDGTGALWSYVYRDLLTNAATSNLTAVIWPNMTAERWVYDGLGRVVAEIDRSAQISFYGWTPEDRLARSINREGQELNFRYDAGGQMIRRIEPSGATTIFGYDSRGQYNLIDDGGCALRFERNTAGQLSRALTEYRLPVSGSQVTLTHALEYEYDAQGRRTLRRDNFGIADERYQYDAQGRVLNFRVGPGAGPYTTWTLNRDASGRPVEIVYPFGGLASDLEYDPVGRLTRVAHGDPAQWEQVASSRLPGGRLAELRQTSTFGTLIRQYLYDPSGRLLSSQWSQALGTTPTMSNFVESAAGRLITDGRFDYIHDREGRLFLAFERGGRLAKRYEWDALSRLIAYEEWDYLTFARLLRTDYRYDGLGRRVMKDVEGIAQMVLYDGPNPIHSLDANGLLEHSFVAAEGVDHPLGVYDHVNRLWWTLHYDLQGNLGAVFTQTGFLAQGVTYDDYGMPLEGQQVLGRFLQGFGGREYDLESGLYQVRARSYDPSTRRYLSESPLGGAEARHPYAFAHSDPINWIESTGLRPELAAQRHWVPFDLEDGASAASAFRLPTLFGPAFVQTEPTLDAPSASDAMTEAVGQQTSGTRRSFFAPLAIPGWIFQSGDFARDPHRRPSIVIISKGGRLRTPGGSLRVQMGTHPSLRQIRRIFQRGVISFGASAGN